MDLSPDHQELLEEVTRMFHLAEENAHRHHRKRWEHFYALYRSYREFKGDMAQRTDRNDRDAGLTAAQREWGAELFIPYVFATIETVLPRLLSNRPQMLILPRSPRSADNVEHVKAMIDSQQRQIDYELKLHPTAKSGLVYGLGAAKTLWKLQTRQTPVIARPTLPRDGVEWVQGGAETRVVHDDPWVEDIDIFDFLWDPVATGIEDTGFIIHRTWRTTGYVMDRLRAKSDGEAEWNLMPDLTEEDVGSSGSPEKYTEAWSGRDRVDGSSSSRGKGMDLHEVWEFHDGERVVKILDRKWPVQAIANPHWHGELPFQIYRPTQVMHQFVGIGEAEPIEDLQKELNVLRGQRRDNATLKLMQSYAFNDGSVDVGDIKIGPGTLIPVNGDPANLLMPLQVGDIPASGYQEEASLVSDMERVTGISDQTAGGNAGPDTATGAQLVQAAANARIQFKGRRLEVEVIRPQARQFLLLSQQRIIKNKTIRVPSLPKPGEPDRRWAWIELNPETIAGEFDVEPDGGSIAPANVPQDRADGLTLMNVFAGRPEVDARKVITEALRRMGFTQPELYMAADRSIPPEVLPVLMGMLTSQFQLPPDEAHGLIDQALVQARQAHDANQQGPPPGPQGAPQEPPQGAPVQAAA